MTFNVLAWHDFTGPIIDTIRAVDPDILFIQELNYGMAEALERELGEVYPYRALEPTGDPSGIGTFSKYPFHPVDLDGASLGGGWIGGPIVLEMEWEGQAVTLVNFHMLPTTGFYSQERTRRDFERRAEQARVLAGLAGRGPTILGGDANSAPISDAYKILTGKLQDAWREAGWGLGHTFPGSAVPGSDRPRIGGVLVPSWLARIDYILFSQEWEVLSARMAKLDGVSDHRGVVAVLRLKEDAR
jgi:endonuclease/exonuclease/phosphatase (EEP) superfamily protein YafD